MSIVIPTLNEAAYLPVLLESIRHQTASPREVLVVDAGSGDGTPEVARAYRARVLGGGGLPGFSRNCGARRTSGEWILFLDADVRLPPTALEEILGEIEAGPLDAASCWFVPDTSEWSLRLNHWLSCHYFRLSSRLGWPHSIGAFLIVRRALHDDVGGFDPTVRVAEDQDYVRRLARAGRYAFVSRPAVRVATRRFRSEGTLKMTLKWVGIELHRIVLGEIRGDYFRYFG